MTSEIWRIFPTTILTSCNNIFIIVSINCMYHFKPLARWSTLADACCPVELFFFFPVLPSFCNNTICSSKNNGTDVMSIVGTLLGVTMEHVACILADDICHFHDAHEGGEGAFFVDVGALADAHDVFVL